MHRESSSSNLPSPSTSRDSNKRDCIKRDCNKRDSSKKEAGSEQRARVNGIGTRAAKISFLARGRGQVPMLRLTGIWLASAGFDIGQRIEIKVQEGRLTIQQVDAPGEGEPMPIS